MVSCEEHVITACGLHLLLQERKLAKQKYWLHKVCTAKQEGGEFHDICKITGKECSNILKL
jgi:hypothetical protein